MSPSEKLSRPKEKVGANPPDETAALRASRELYGNGFREASKALKRVVKQFEQRLLCNI